MRIAFGARDREPLTKPNHADADDRALRSPGDLERKHLLLWLTERSEHEIHLWGDRSDDLILLLGSEEAAAHPADHDAGIEALELVRSQSYYLGLVADKIDMRAGRQRGNDIGHQVRAVAIFRKGLAPDDTAPNIHADAIVEKEDVAGCFSESQIAASSIDGMRIGEADDGRRSIFDDRDNMRNGVRSSRHANG